MAYMRDRKRRRLDSIEVPSRPEVNAYAQSWPQRGAAMGCSLYLTSTRNIGTANPTVISFTDERWDSDSLHSNSTDTSRITIPQDGIWLIQGSIEFSASSSGATREAMIYRNGNAATSDRRPSIGAARATVVNVSYVAIAIAGDYFQLYGYHDSGATLTAGNTYTQFSAIRLGDSIGAFVNMDGARLFGADLKYKGFGAYTLVPSVQPAERVFVTDDPMKGASRQVMSVTVTNADDSVSYPRAQFQSPSNLTEGSDVYIGYSVLVPDDIGNMTGRRSPVIHEVYGPPTTGYGPTVFRIRDNALALEPEVIYEPTTGAATGKHLAWSLSLDGLKGKWVDVVQRVKLSTDPAIGLQELWINTGSGLTKQTLRDPHTGAIVGETLNLATLRSGVNDGGNNFSSLKLAYTDLSIGSVSIFYAGHNVSSTLAAADPKSY